MNPSRSESWSGGRLAGIDALRGLAALGVVLYHTVDVTRDGVPQNFLRWPLLFLHSLTSFGYVWVFLFFVISGFCIHLQWAKARSSDKPHELRFGSFWKRRIRRLYPAYLIALTLYLVMSALSTGLKVTGTLIYDVTMHLFMLHNLDPKTAYSINSVFWTLAIEEQLYLAYFLLLFLRRRWGWGPTLLVCAAARVGWFFFSHGVWVVWGVGVPVPEAAASHWLTWALGAVSVEAAFGLIKLPRWCSNLLVAAGFLIFAAGISQVFPVTNKDGLIHRFCWLILHPAWGVAFFIIVNRAFAAERRWRAAIGSIGTPRLVKLMAGLGVFSYSLYLTHNLVIMESWRFSFPHGPNLVNALFIVTPATVAFAWIFYQFCERPFMSSPAKAQTTKVAEEISDTPQPIFVQGLMPQPED
ncbi:MAG: acyltransferase family protein [Acidobacteria bacterium]|nr:acyltransferase family protein [Acidobacteriota bacterium]